jgi:FlaA1/EpsC-like NDP-sugar epimerase
MFGLYRSRRLSTRRAELADVLKATTFSIACLVGVGTILSIRMLTVPFLVDFLGDQHARAVCLTCRLRAALTHIRARGRNLRYLLIFGTNPRAVAFAQRIAASPERGYRLLGFVDDEWPGWPNFAVADFGWFATMRVWQNFSGAML